MLVCVGVLVSRCFGSRLEVSAHFIVHSDALEFAINVPVCMRRTHTT